MAKVILLFVDGVGVGKAEETINPCVQANGTIFKLFMESQGLDAPASLPYGGIPRALDASLGVKGFPQSGTGQTAILTGLNAAQIAGRHVPAFPTKRLREVIAEHSLLKQIVAQQKRAVFLNAYRPTFFAQEHSRLQRWLTASTLANQAAGLPFHTLEDVQAERALYHDFTNQKLREMGFTLPRFSPAQAGAILAQQSSCCDFLFFEYFQTDFAGHAQDMEWGIQEIEKLEQFLQSILTTIDLASTILFLVSDHGNIEDMSVKTHTKNKAMAVVWGVHNTGLAHTLHTLTDIAPAILQGLIL
jgi:hypothetical protein